MKQTNSLTTQPSEASLTRRMVAGAGIGLVLISLFLLSANEPDPEWGKFWMVRPLIIVPLAGAMGGLCNYFIVRFHSVAGVSKVLAWIFSLLIFLVGLWMGVVLGLDGTLWD